MKRTSLDLRKRGSFVFLTWHEVISEQTIADAIIDRIIHNVLRIELEGESLKQKEEPETNTKNQNKPSSKNTY